MPQIPLEDMLNGMKEAKLIKHGKSDLLSMRVSKALAALAVVTITGCASPAMESANQAVNDSYGQVKIKEVTTENFIDIIKNQKSGIYQHPLYSDQLITYHFSEDKNAEESIKNDLRMYGLNGSAFGYNRKLLELVQGSDSVASRHIQDPLSFLPDINYSFINANGSVHKGDEYEQMHRIVQLYYTMLHEAGHSVHHQQMSMLDLSKLAYDRTQIYELEVSSDYIGLIKTIQFLDELKDDPAYDGSVKIDEKFINEFIDRQEESRRNVLQTYTKASELLEDHPHHRSVQAIAMVREQFKYNPQDVYAMTNGDTIKTSEVVAVNSVSYDFKYDFIKEITAPKTEHKRLNPEFELGLVTESMLEILRANVESVNAHSGKLLENADRLLKAADAIESDHMKKIAIEIAESPEAYFKISQKDSNKASQVALDNTIDKLLLTDIDDHRMISYMSDFHGFIDHVKENLAKEGIYLQEPGQINMMVELDNDKKKDYTMAMY